MIPFFASLTKALRRARGLGDDGLSDLRRELGRRKGGDLLRGKRIKVALLAILFGMVSGAIDLPLPAEDLYRAARAQLRLRPAPQDIAFIAIDDRTIAAFGGKMPSRMQDSEVIDRLAAAGVSKILFDRAHADPETPEADARFAETLARHRGKVWLGFSPETWLGAQLGPEILPLPQFRAHAGLASMLGIGSPFGLSITLDSQTELRGESYRSISAVMADYTGPARRYRPDYAFDPRSIPRFSYLDVLEGKVPAGALQGRKVIIGEAYFASTDVYVMPFGADPVLPGAYFHILGAHTLRRGAPIDLGWLPALLAAGLLVLTISAIRGRSRRVVGLSIAGLLILPLVLDEYGVNLDIMPALLVLGAAGFGFARLNRKYFNRDVDALSPTAISSDRPNPRVDVYALKIANLTAMSEELSAREIGDFVNSLIAFVRGPGEAGEVAFERDLLIWLAPRMGRLELERHADGLALMLKTAIGHDWQSANGAPALGIDTNSDLPLGLRIKKAMQAAEEAAARGARLLINDAAHLEARNNRIELFRMLEKGLRERAIGVAYQPKIDLATGRIVGAETLIRWQPQGSEPINPQELVLAAEASERINELTLLVMEKALIEGKRAIALDPNFKLAINMSAKSLSDTQLLFDMMTLLGRHDFPPGNLVLELTETAKLEDDRIAPQIAALKQRGIGLSIDDFGTGQSNLEYIEKLPSSELKIDKHFVQHMVSSEESRAVVRATIEIAHALGKVVVAEGVESPAVAAMLRAMGCDLGQGYLFSRAITMSELTAMMGGGRAAING